MENFQWMNLIWFLLAIAATELVVIGMNLYRKRKKLRKWVNSFYQPMPPSSFSEEWAEDFRYYIILVFIVIYSFCGNIDILIVALINIYLVVNTVIHLSKRWSKIISFINRLQIDEKGVHSHNNKKCWSFDDFYLMSVRNWFDSKIKFINSQLIEGIKICRQNRIESCYYLDNIDMRFSRDEFINKYSQSIYSNKIFLLHLLAVIVVNSVLLLEMARSEMLTLEINKCITQNVEDVIYVILQVFSTIGFGDVSSTAVLGKVFFVIMFIQAILTIILGVVYKDFALNMATLRFDEMVENINALIDSQKRLCINSILTKKIPFKSVDDVLEEHIFCSQTVFDKLKEYV